MNKKEVAELKRLFHPDRSPITRICGCYVAAANTKRNSAEEDEELSASPDPSLAHAHKVAELKEAFLSLPEEEMFKYFDIFKKTLSGTLGRNLLDMEFPLEQEAGGGTQEFLMLLKKSQLKDDALLEEFYEKVIETFLYPENYYIVLIHCAYDIPKKATDGLEMFDASDDVYEFLLCSICPVKLSKPGLCYRADTNTIGERSRDWFVEAPITGFLFPAFTDRNTDIHSLLYFSKNPDELNADFARALLGCEMPLSAGSQKDTFNALVAETLSDSCTYETVKQIHSSLNELLEEHKDDPNPVLLDRADVKHLLSLNGADDEVLEHFDDDFEQVSGSKQAELYVTNVASTRKFEIKTPNVVITVKPECADLVETRTIDGRLCFVIPADDSVEVNGIPVNTGSSPDITDED